jgi:hypothetical protein
LPFAAPHPISIGSQWRVGIAPHARLTVIHK